MGIEYKIHPEFNQIMHKITSTFEILKKKIELSTVHRHKAMTTD